MAPAWAFGRSRQRNCLATHRPMRKISSYCRAYLPRQLSLIERNGANNVLPGSAQEHITCRMHDAFEGFSQDPMEGCVQWLNMAAASEPNDPNAAALSTVIVLPLSIRCQWEGT